MKKDLPFRLQISFGIGFINQGLAEEHLHSTKNFGESFLIILNVTIYDIIIKSRFEH